ncbi:MAG: autotransporter outer membrane beta-barrel domain-containing protein, partial [Desulfovibrionaceae bacterium]|nr:autotransporter outer membrane beta-barrel domain-containing protein [Desulfovibrionaceae bacterium]
EGEANTATLGVGLHVYGSNNTITQAADLLACGTAGTGIRVDGSENKITVAEGVTVAADGEYGTGLLVSYGKDHEIVSAGTITANGTGGIAVRFDFGSNNNGDEVQYRGSWLWGSWNSDTKEWVSNSFTDAYNEDVGQYYDESGWPLNLDGALVKSFDISGTIEGSAAAVYIAARAYVQQINVLSGAAVTGDIISDWDPENKLIQYEVVNTDRSNADLTTLITFGRLAGENGQATSEADPDFSLAYSGNITGSKSLQLEVSGGSLEYSGTASVLSVTVKEGAELTGSGSYALSTIFADTENEKGGLFLNEGTFAPDTGLAAGDSAEDVTAVSIKGDYTQTSTGTLSLGFNGSAAANSLSITGAAVLAGALELAPVQDYYSGSVTLALADLVSAESLTIAEDGLAAAVSLASPTLTMTLAAEGEGTDTAYTIGTSRAANAYSQYAASGQQTDIARNFDELGQQDLTDLSGDAGDARNLLAAMDFSAADGSDLASAYKQLGPDTHTRAAQAVLDLQRTLTSQVVAGRLLSQAGTPAASAKASGQAMAAGDESAATGARVFATPMGGRNVNFASGGSDTSYYGLLAGAETDLALGQDNLTLGVHAAFLHIEGSAHTDDDITGDSLSLGLHGRWDPDMNLDAGAFGSVSPYVFGLARGGIETRHTDRKVAFNGFNRTAESDWTAPTFSAALGTGLDIRPSGTPGDSLVFGPVLWLDYTALWRPAFTEDNGRAADLDVEAATYQSLRSSLGARMNVRLHEGPDAARLAGSLDLSLAAVWNHEYLYDNGGTKASFAHFGSSSFTDRADVEDRDTFGGTLQLTGHLSDNVTLSLFGGIEEGRSTSDAHGGASLVWSF